MKPLPPLPPPPPLFAPVLDLAAEDLLRRTINALGKYCRENQGELPDEEWLLFLVEHLYRADLQLRGVDVFKANLLAAQFVHGRPDYPPLDPKDL